MTNRIIIDPVTRIEGHLRIEAETDAEGVVVSAASTGTMVRGLEIILKGRDPRDAWAFAQRICGVCTLVHGIASVRAVEDALKYTIPPNAQLIRNLMIAAQFVHDHVIELTGERFIAPHSRIIDGHADHVCIVEEQFFCFNLLVVFPCLEELQVRLILFEKVGECH